MTDATQRPAHEHASDDAHGHGHTHAAPHAPRLSASPEPLSRLEASAAGRLLGVFPVIAAIWAGVYWALH